MIAPFSSMPIGSVAATRFFASRFFASCFDSRFFNSRFMASFRATETVDDYPMPRSRITFLIYVCFASPEQLLQIKSLKLALQAPN